MNANASRAKQDRLVFRRADYIGTSIILGIIVVGSVLFGLGGPALNAVNDAPLPVSYTTPVTGIELPRGATHDGEATVELLLKDATFGERLAQSLPGLLLAGLTIAVAWLLFQLLRSTQAGEPFTRRNVARVNATALIVGLGGVLVQVAQAFADSVILTSGRLPDSRGSTWIFTMSFSPVPLVIMLVIALIGQAFRRGVELRSDVDGLV